MSLFLFVQLGFQLGDSAIQLLDFLKHGVGQVGVVEGGTIVILATDDTTGVADNSTIPTDTFQHDCPCTDLDVFAESDWPQYLGTCTDHDAVFDGRVTFTMILAGAAKGNALINGHIVTDFGCLADHNTGTVVNEEPPADCGTGVNLNAGAALCDGGDPSG